MHALISLHTSNYQPLADLTWNQNKLLYANQHGYKAFCKTDNFYPNVNVGYQKIYFIRDLLKENSDLDWIWWTGTDAIITNFATRIEDRIDNNYHFIITTDVNGINADSFLIRNSDIGKEIIRDILLLETESCKHWDVEQRAVATALGLPYTASPDWIITPFLNQIINEKYRNFVKIMPQRFMNSYHYSFYHYTDIRDKLGIPGQWEIGDWLIHWPATSLEHRLQFFPYWSQFIAK